ncbi:DNA-binding transcriptional LysR family regulator [Rhizobium sp. SG_E_25_P2]|uniref:LysR family transcriptional regulator n=1 Tax=Rhizobium sp. SG_E_25_P2 TaxID=2879942 RepID=UPI00247710F0|nr:LysR family transcriptional regulator [Rhizobium sp. SG_E_25_P2]MDH6265607.1 DNA-binding transcriptional LysR family regulator [Rhizobium sp. SG_E_25_P2]
MDVDALDAFLKIAELRSLSAVAKLYGQPKSTLSLRLKQLEGELGTELFLREGRALVLTEAGQTLRAHAADILGRCEAARMAVAETLDDASGMLRIGATGEFGTAFYSQMLFAFRRRYPKVQLDLSFFSPHTLYLPERQEMMDAIISWDDGNTARGGAEQLWADRFCLYASRDYLARMGEPTTPADLGNHQAVMFRQPSGPQPWLLQKDTEVASVLPRCDLFANEYWTVKYFAVAGEGIAYLPSFFTQIECERGDLMRVLPGWESAAQRVTLRVMRPSALSRRMGAFIDFCRDYFSPGYVFNGPRYYVETIVNPPEDTPRGDLP